MALQCRSEYLAAAEEKDGRSSSPSDLFADSEEAYAAEGEGRDADEGEGRVAPLLSTSKGLSGQLAVITQVRKQVIQ